MTLASRLIDFINSLGSDIKSLQSQILNIEQAMLPTSVKQLNQPMSSIANNISALSSGRLTLVRVPVKKGQQITGISFISVNQASAPTNQVFALYDQNRNLIGTTANDGSTSWPANTRKRLVLDTPYTPTADGWLYAGIMVTGTSMPTLAGIGTMVAVTGMAPIIHGHSTTGLTTPASFPATAAALTAVAGTVAVMLD